MKQTSYFLTNKDIGSENNYLPILVLGDGTKTLSDEEQAKQILKVNGANITTAKADNGMTIERKDILPWHQGAIEADFIKVISRGIEREEHFKAYGAMIRDYNEIFRGKSNESKELQEKIKIMHGNAAMEAIGTWINHQATPTAKSVGRGDKMERVSADKFLCVLTSAVKILYHIFVYYTKLKHTV
ncbi:hypothetical protein FACS1894102_6790 [Spirochaetia bacterium]|nr:hypothetical protein FACS1894102_6790 [Spirochaetia bacterium]